MSGSTPDGGVVEQLQRVRPGVLEMDHLVTIANDIDERQRTIFVRETVPNKSSRSVSWNAFPACTRSLWPSRVLHSVE